MIAWSIEAAQESGCFDQIIVSTDDQEIARTARLCGALTPFMRPANLADDHTGTVPVIAHAITEMQSQGVFATEVCCIYATAPFVQPADICMGLDVLINSSADLAFSVTDFPYPIQRAFRITDDGRVEMFHPELFNVRSQDLEVAWHDAAQFYWGHASAWLSGRPIFSTRSAPVVLPRHRVQDIDTLEDWVQAEWIFKAQQLAGA